MAGKDEGKDGVHAAAEEVEAEACRPRQVAPQLQRAAMIAGVALVAVMAMARKPPTA